MLVLTPGAKPSRLLLHRRLGGGQYLASRTVSSLCLEVADFASTLPVSVPRWQQLCILVAVNRSDGCCFSTGLGVSVLRKPCSLQLIC